MSKEPFLEQFNKEIGTKRLFKGVFFIEKTHNLFDFIDEDEKRAIYDDITGEKLFKYGKINPKAKINEIGTIVGENLFMVKKYPHTIFRDNQLTP